MESFLDIIGCWPTLDDFAQEIGVKVSHARVMKHRNSISSQFWLPVAAAAQKRGFDDITVAKLADIQASRMGRKDAAA